MGEVERPRVGRQDRVSPDVARKLIRRILQEGIVVYSEHAKREMQNDALTIVDCANVLRAGAVNEAEYEHGAWRYQVQTQRICVVVQFESESELVIITTWRRRQ
jgi:hypothetical protein